MFFINMIRSIANVWWMIIRTARSVAVKLSEGYPYQEIYDQKFVLEKYPLHMFQPVVTI